MRLECVTALIVSLASSLAIPATGVAQDVWDDEDPVIEIFDCSDQDLVGGHWPGCDGYVDEEMLDYAELMKIRAIEIAPYLPQNIRIDVLFDLSDGISHRTVSGEADLITIGQGMMIDMWNSYVDVWDLYDYEGYAYDHTADFAAFLEWALYHEIGHALVEHSGFQTDDQDHERLADRFATVALILMYGGGDESGMPAEQAAQGLFFLSLPEGHRNAVQSAGRRNAFERVPPKKKQVSKRRGLDGSLGAHQPSPQRAWEIACLVYGSSYGRPYPGDYPAAQDTVYVCQQKDYNNAIWELDQYVPSMPDVELIP